MKTNIVCESWHLNSYSLLLAGPRARRGFFIPRLSRGIAAAVRVVRQIPRRGDAHPLDHRLLAVKRYLIRDSRHVIVDYAP